MASAGEMQMKEMKMKEVAPNRVSILKFNVKSKEESNGKSNGEPKEEFNAVGISSLSGGTAVAIVSGQAAILLHIARLPDGTGDGEAELAHFRLRLEDMMDCYTNSSKHFPSDSTSVYVAERRKEDLDGRPHPMNEIGYILNALCLGRPLVAHYAVRPAGEGPAFVIDARNLEDVQILVDEDESRMSASD
ncbi:hypothetical protein P170DRAFT_435801 [Aspergillus steynii IBT 23096]|uniref:Uncharacterized protein n=1 Tax=Aspergillus steynii IBT 23096 TaxID=1392250 RepID=A0A2I2GCK7_9EURO|nr:uncharacterized protein P170DRAFT_435801 [Aspergillus steynii IBT 23096]PLB50614.1 hypothetical protein P170DRAFT_435801 [Aspergillus steynii IBT 23096]